MKDAQGLQITAEQAEKAADAALSAPGPDATEVLISGSRTGLTRFASSEIIQNTVRSEVRAYVRVAIGDKVASAMTNQLDPEHMQGAVASALEAAQASMSDSDFTGLPTPDEAGAEKGCWHWDNDCANSTPSDRAEAVGRLLDASGGLSVAGVYETSGHAYGLYSSTGLRRFDAHTRCIVTCLADTGDATGWGESSSYARSEVDVVAAVERAATKARTPKAVGELEPGTYEVVLEAPAVATMLEYLSYCGFGAKQVIEGESFLATKTGEMVAAPEVTVADDVWHPRSVGVGFDFEGVTKQRVPVIDGGKANAPVTDRRTSAKLGGESTGHYSGSNEFGPYAAHVVLEPGQSSLDELIKGISSGLLVTRFHYVNILDRPGTLLTGMTRDGTFRVENGEITGAVNNLRFTQSVLETLATTKAIGKDLHAFAPEFSSFGSTVAPALHLGEFRFTSTTSH